MCIAPAAYADFYADSYSSDGSLDFFFIFLTENSVEISGADYPVCMHVCMCVYVCVYVCMYMCVCVCTDLRGCMLNTYILCQLHVLVKQQQRLLLDSCIISISFSLLCSGILSKGNFCCKSLGLFSLKSTYLIYRFTVHNESSN